MFEPFTQRHFIQTFSKKYRGAWDKTYNALLLEFGQVELLFLKSIAETVIDSPDIKICKTEFKISGTPVSRHASGNRCVIAIHKSSCTVHVLLVYHKNDLSGHNETVEWQQIIKNNYPAYKHLF